METDPRLGPGAPQHAQQPVAVALIFHGREVSERLSAVALRVAPALPQLDVVVLPYEAGGRRRQP